MCPPPRRQKDGSDEPLFQPAFVPVKVGANKKTDAFIVQRNDCVRIFGTLGLTLLLLLLLLANSANRRVKLIEDIEQEQTIQHNRDQLQVLGAATDALDAESFHEDNLDYISKMRSQNARMFMLLSNFETNINGTIDTLADKSGRNKLHEQVQKLSADLTYRLKDVQSTLDLDFTASDSQLAHVDKKLGTLLNASKQLSKPITQKQKAARVKQSLENWRGAAKNKSAKRAKAGQLRVKLASFAEVVKKSKDKKAASTELKMKKMLLKKHIAAVEEHLAQKKEAGAKRKKLEESNRKMQMKLQRIFERVHGLPNIDVSSETLAEWRGYIKEYNEVLRSHKGNFVGNWQSRLRVLASSMAKVLKSPDGQKYVSRMYKSTFFQMKTKLSASTNVDQTFINTQIRAHPFRTFQQLTKIAGYNVGKYKVLNIERNLRLNKITSFGAWISLRKLMREKQAPKLALHAKKKRQQG